MLFPQVSTGEYESLRRRFESWLSRENELLSGILRAKGAAADAKELKARQDTLKVSEDTWVMSSGGRGHSRADRTNDHSAGIFSK